MNYLEFRTLISGFKFFNKKTNDQVFTYQMFWSNLSKEQCFKMFNTVVRDRNVIK